MPFLIRRFGWNFAPIWVEVTPERDTWWPEGDLTKTPTVWRNSSANAPASDPGPRGPRLPSRRPAPTTSVGPPPWAINGPLRTASAGYPGSAMSAQGRSVPASEHEDRDLPSWPCEFDGRALLGGAMLVGRLLGLAWIDDYNQNRRHSALQMQSPVGYELSLDP
jgi:hypothetical protein